MTQRYLVTHTVHFINGALVHPDQGDASVVTLPAGVEPGRWLVPVDSGSKGIASASIPTIERYKAKHNGGGRWIVENVDDGSRASVVFEKDEGDAKAKAEAEAARLNAGGDLDLGDKDVEPSSGQVEADAGTQQDEHGGSLPDA
jgi:hypothetical protein